MAYVQDHSPFEFLIRLGTLLATVRAIVLINDLLVAVLARARHVHRVVLLGVKDNAFGAEVVRLVSQAHLLVLDHVERLPVVHASLHGSSTAGILAATAILIGQVLALLMVALVEPSSHFVSLWYVRVYLND